MSGDGPDNGVDDGAVEILEKKIVYQGFFRVEQYRLRHRLFAGGMSPELRRELFERSDAVAMLPYDPQRDRVVLVEQFRIGALSEPGGAWLLEIPAGMVESGEQPGEVAARELYEESGCRTQALEPIGRFLASRGGSSEVIWLYCAWVDARLAGGLHGLASEGEDIRVLAVDFDQAIDWCAAGRIVSASPLIALQWLQLHRERLRRLWAPVVE